MRLNVAPLLKAAIGATQDYVLSEVVDITGDGSDSLVQGEVTLMRYRRGILAKGRFRTEVMVVCSRCLGLFRCPLVLNIVEEYLENKGRETEGYFIVNRRTLDLGEALRQNALLAIPMKPLCQEDCAGLCPQCGHNLNQGACGCVRDKAARAGLN